MAATDVKKQGMAAHRGHSGGLTVCSCEQQVFYVNGRGRGKKAGVGCIEGSQRGPSGQQLLSMGQTACNT